MKKYVFTAISCFMIVLPLQAKATDIIENGNNQLFSEEIRPLGYGFCLTNTYAAYVSNDDDGSAYNVTYDQSKKIAFDVYQQSGWKVLKTTSGPNYHTDIVEIVLSSGTVVRAAYKYTYVNGYELIQRCRLK